MAASHAAITINTTSLTTNSKDRDQYIGTPAWLDAAKFPQATFTTTSFEKSGADKFIAHGKLALHGISLPVDLPFTLTIANNVATMDGDLTLNRLDYGIGSAEWADPKTVGTVIKVRVLVVATTGRP